MLATIRQARDHVNMESYIIDDDEDCCNAGSSAY
jgi:hypothetical protein